MRLLLLLGFVMPNGRGANIGADQVFDKAGSARMGGNQGELRVLHMRRYDSPPTKKVKVDLAKDE